MRSSILCVFFALLLVIPGAVSALSLSSVSDLISTSRPSATSTHVIQFRVAQAIAPSGSFTITPQAGSLTIPVGFDYTDVDLAISTGGPYTDRSLAGSASAIADGVSVSTGSSGSITITLNSVSGIAAGEYVQVELGSIATYEFTGDSWITNAASAGSYHVVITTKTPLGATLDTAQAVVAMIQPVVLTAINQNSPPTILNSLPTTTVAANNGEIELSFETDEYAFCRYSKTAGVSYSAMTNTFTHVANQLFYTTVNGHVNNTTYTYYIRCQDLYGTDNTSDYELTFTIDEDPISNTSVFVGGVSGSGGVGPFPNGSSYLYLASVRFMGYSSPLSTITILKDGTVAATTRAASTGRFDVTVSGIERGAYTFAAYATDRARRKSATHASTISLVQGTAHVISNIAIPPTISLSSTKIGVGEGATVEGAATPGSTIELFVTPTGTSLAKKYSTVAVSAATSSEHGAWTIALPSRDIPRGSYSVRARALITAQTRSAYTETITLTVGDAIVPASGTKGDINGDEKINLVDFSILLSHWGTADTSADLNADGKVDLADFSIMLFNWTG